MPEIKIIHGDCMEYMATLPDKAFDLAIVDPPYGINIAEWDKNIPSEKNFTDLFRVSKNQIIWGGNYFNLPHTEGWICWHKTYNYGDGGFKGMSDFELAWTSFLKKAKYYPYQYIGNCIGGKPNYYFIRIHPTQKPVALYDWILRNYAKPGQRILDTHLGSGSSAIAAHYFGCDFVGCEIDVDYFNAAKERFDRETRQVAMF